MSSQELNKKMLTKEQKVNDFLAAYQALKENYPYFGVCKRLHKLDWLAKKDEYLAKIEATQNDKEYVLALQEIFGELRDGHLNFNAAWSGTGAYIQIYKSIVAKFPHYQKWLDVFEDPRINLDYWTNIFRTIYMEQMAKSQNAQEDSGKSQAPTYTDELLDGGKIALMNISSFDPGLLDKVKPLMADFLTKIEKADYLIINIQDNFGGSTEYWQEYLVKRLIASPLIAQSTQIIKNGAINRNFYDFFFENAHPICKQADLPKMPEELLEEDFYMLTDSEEFLPDNPVAFKGKIFLLVNKVVFSASENFAYFCKNTKFATVVGERTGGDGGGGDPIAFLLPESGLVMFYPARGSLNIDGSLNAEEKTVPDLEIKASSSEERLKKLIEHLRKL